MDQGRQRETFLEQTQPTVKGDSNIKPLTGILLTGIKNSLRGLLVPKII